MNTQPKKPKKVKVTLSITLEAQDIMFDNGYASQRTMGEFISRLVVDYHYRAGRGSRPSSTTPHQTDAPTR